MTHRRSRVCLTFALGMRQHGEFESENEEDENEEEEEDKQKPSLVLSLCVILLKLLHEALGGGDLL